MFLMIFSTVNFIYVFTVFPLDDTKENRIEVFNEICILACAHIFNILLRSEGGPIFIGKVGWAFIGVSVFNVFCNLVLLIFDSLSKAFENLLNYRKVKSIKEQVQ